jgi:general secretion pathway protein G
MPKGSKRRDEGFTLIELMVVLIILALLATVIVPNVIGKSDDAKQTKARADIATIESLLDQYYLDVGRYPETDEGLRALYFKPDSAEGTWKGPYSKKPIPPDPWGVPYGYASPGLRSALPYEIWSYGRDKQEGGDGYDADIVSWADVEDYRY